MVYRSLVRVILLLLGSEPLSEFNRGADTCLCITNASEIIHLCREILWAYGWGFDTSEFHLDEIDSQIYHQLVESNFGNPVAAIVSCVISELMKAEWMS